MRCPSSHNLKFAMQIKSLICSGMMRDHILLWERDVFRFTYILRLGHGVCGFPGLLHGGMICVILDEVLSAVSSPFPAEGQGLLTTNKRPVLGSCCSSHALQSNASLLTAAHEEDDPGRGVAPGATLHGQAGCRNA